MVIVIRNTSPSSYHYFNYVLGASQLYVSIYWKVVTFPSCSIILFQKINLPWAIKTFYYLNFLPEQEKSSCYNIKIRLVFMGVYIDICGIFELTSGCNIRIQNMNRIQKNLIISTIYDDPMKSNDKCYILCYLFCFIFSEMFVVYHFEIFFSHHGSRKFYIQSSFIVIFVYIFIYLFSIFIFQLFLS